MSLSGILCSAHKLNNPYKHTTRSADTGPVMMTYFFSTLDRQVTPHMQPACLPSLADEPCGGGITTWWGERHPSMYLASTCDFPSEDPKSITLLLLLGFSRPVRRWLIDYREKSNLKCRNPTSRHAVGGKRERNGTEWRKIARVITKCTKYQEAAKVFDVDVRKIELLLPLCEKSI